MTTLITGAAGFVGFHVAQALLDDGDGVIGIDNCNAYYDLRIKRARLDRLKTRAGFVFHEADIADPAVIEHILSTASGVTRVIHLTAQAGVRYSLSNPFSYVQANVHGHLAVIEAARRLATCQHVVYASSSSVYGDNAVPFVEGDRVDRPRSVYAATKRSGELLGEVYAYLYGLPQTGLRLFTVYGPWGRPDMAYFRFDDDIMLQRPITLFDGVVRDFTFIGDAVDGIMAVLASPPAGAEPHRVLNLGNSRPLPVIELVRSLEDGLGKKAILQFSERPKADVPQTYASTDAIEQLAGFRARTDLRDGIAAFLDWYRPWFERHGASSGQPYEPPGER
jgi:UDP-glucuronate 4-epimerase